MVEDRGERLQIMLSQDELMMLDTFRFEKRMPSRAAAVRELLKRGLAAEGFDEAKFGAKSSEYGVKGDDPKGRGGHAKK
jgi:hypothetical protein